MATSDKRVFLAHPPPHPEDELAFADEEEPSERANLPTDSLSRKEQSPWKVMIIDDDVDIHALTRVILRGIHFDGLDLNLLSGYSGADAKRMLAEHPDTAILLLDVVMETDDAGLEVARYIRQELKNPFVRIILRTGQPGQAPEMSVISQYDINDYKEKTDLSDQKLISTVMVCLRAYRDLRALEKSEERFRALAQSATNAIIAANEEGLVTFWNLGAEAIFGFQEKEILGQPLTRLMPERYRQDHINGLREVSRARHPFTPKKTFETYAQRQDGTEFPVSISLGTGISDGARFFSAIIQDITERKKAEAALENNRQRLAKAQEIAHLGNWEWDITAGTSLWSDEVFRILDLPIGEHLPNQGSFLDAIHPEDRDHFQRTLDAALFEKQAFNLEHRMVRPDGSVRFTLSQGEVDRDAKGRPVRMLCTLLDITERREAENKLKIATRVFNDAMHLAEDHIQITTQVFDNAIEGVMVTDSEGMIQSVNPAFSAITGYTPQEVIGKNPRLLRSGRQESGFYREMWDQITNQGQWQGEIWNRRKDGEAFPQSLTITAIRDKNGTITNFVGLFHDLTDIKRSEEELRYTIFHDTLTSLPNRNLFQDRLQQAIRHAHRDQEKIMILVFNLDRFKDVNNSLGFASGDMLLQETASRLQGVLREGDTTGRLSGDSFALIIRDIKEYTDTVHVVRKLVTALSRPYRFEARELFLTASIGVSLFPDDGDNAQTLIKNAEIAVTRAKNAGRDQCQFYTRMMGEQAENRLVLEGDMRQALERQEYLLHYQPKVDLTSGRIVGMEALVRWNRPKVGTVSPLDFIPLAEETGLIVPLGLWILKEACQMARSCMDLGLGPLRVGVNLSARQFQQEDLLETVEATLAKSGIPAQLLELEITESTAMVDVKQVIATMGQLNDMGVFISVDDFGTGYSSLSYLKQFPIHTLKIDRSFVMHLPDDSEDAAIVSATIAIARGLHLKVVAEGVENADQLEFLRVNGCDEIQGYHYSPPLTEEDFIHLLKEEKFKFSSTA
ncbi:MAG: EAL domain-containing protein [Magnetococcales bacterium]|nr:EAL domain-containing protein [Magnetococcales bacterium]